MSVQACLQLSRYYSNAGSIIYIADVHAHLKAAQCSYMPVLHIA